MAVADELGDAGIVGQVLTDADHELALDGGELLEGSSIGRAPPPSMRAIADWVVPIRSASSAWVSPASVRSR